MPEVSTKADDNVFDICEIDRSRDLDGHAGKPCDHGDGIVQIVEGGRFGDSLCIAEGGLS